MANNYIYGNNARQEYELPSQGRQLREERLRREQVVQNRRRESSMGFGHTLLLTVAVVVCLLVCVNYLQIRSQITSSIDRATELENELIEIKSANDSAYNRIMAGVDLEAVRNTAVNEYGMVYADKSQIITYSADSEDYMRQVKEFPEK